MRKIFEISRNVIVFSVHPEIAGKAGLGKTQICLQLCATVQVPAELGGLGGRAVYLDTEGDFCGERMAEVRSCVKDK